ncbi:MAG: glycosyl hydrolase family 28 protein [Lachnospiraceae bacterium]|nr:glycosyl hydrolase family 28 protein [Lachnospiraceae bacterium]
MDYHVREYGALGDGITNDTQAIQAAVDACHLNGGGRVVLESGHIYRAGTLFLRSFVELHLEMGAVLKGSDSLADYNLMGLQDERPADISRPTYEKCDYAGAPTLYFLYARDCESVSITGYGKIDGNEEIFYGTVTPWHIDGSFYPRIPLLFLKNVSHLTLQQVTLTNSAFWTVHMVGCEDVLIDGIRILNSLRMANCDGIDPDHCKNVRISNCHIESADDCIVFKNTAHAMEYGPCENITVSGCTLVSTSAAIKFGTESEAPFRNITIENCSIHHSNRGISLQLRDQGCIENVIFSNLTISTRLFSPAHWWGRAEPIAITAVRRSEETNIGYIRNVLFSNIYCEGENGIFIYGDKSSNIQDIQFERVSLHLKKCTDWPQGSHDLRPCSGTDMLSDKNAAAVYARSAERISFSNLKVMIDDDMKAVFSQITDTEDCAAFHPALGN